VQVAAAEPADEDPLQDEGVQVPQFAADGLERG